MGKNVREAVGLIQVKEKKSLKILVSKFGQFGLLPIFDENLPQ
jgi:hypothetical protein